MLIAASVILIVLYQELWQGRSSAVAIYKPADTAVNESSGRSSDTSGLATMESPDVSTRRGKLSAQPKVFTSGTSTPSLASLLASARDFKERGMLQQAEQTYRNILREFPSDLSSEAEIDRMEQDRSMQQQAERARTSREAGLTKFRRGDYAGAQVDLVEAVNAGRTDTAVLYSLGMSYLKLKSYPQALATLNRCLNSTPDYPPALVGLALVQESMGNKEHALSLLNRALVLGGGAEFSTSKIKDMIANLNLEPSAPPKQPRTFSAFAVHRHSFLSGGCRGKLTVSGSVVEFQSDHPSHSFRLPSANLFPVKSSENEFRLYVNGTQYKFILEGKSVSALLTALGPE
jgi:tetratricopeptide (TPR) repeat protein